MTLKLLRWKKFSQFAQYCSKSNEKFWTVLFKFKNNVQCRSSCGWIRIP